MFLGIENAFDNYRKIKEGIYFCEIKNVERHNEKIIYLLDYYDPDDKNRKYVYSHYSLKGNSWLKTKSLLIPILNYYLGLNLKPDLNITELMNYSKKLISPLKPIQFRVEQNGDYKNLRFIY